MDKLADLLSNGVIITDPELNVFAWNRWLEFQTQISESDIVGKKLTDFFPGIKKKTFSRRIKTTLTLNSPAFYNPSEGYLIPIKTEKITNALFEYMQQGIKILPYESEKDRVLILIHDHTEMKEAYHSIEVVNQRARHYLDVIDRYVYTLITDAEGIILDASTAFCEKNGTTKEAIIGKKSNLFRHPDTPDELYEEMWSTIKHKQTWHGELRNRTLDGEEYWVKSSIFYLEEENGQIRYQAIQEDITDKKQVENLSITDELTKLYNRRHFNQVFSKELHRAKRNQSAIAFIIMDVDNFKRYNDTYGHVQGDMALITISTALRDMFRRAGDYAFRLGGEEFGVLFSEIDPDHIPSLAEKLRKNIEEIGLEHKTNPPYNVVTVSIGIYIADMREADSTKHTEPDSIYKMADEALYQAKKNGRNRIEIFSHT